MANTKFDFDQSAVADTAQEIRSMVHTESNGAENRKRGVETDEEKELRGLRRLQMLELSGKALRAKKSEMSVTVHLPVEYYQRLQELKVDTGMPIRDIARDVVMDWLDEQKKEDEKVK